MDWPGDDPFLEKDTNGELNIMIRLIMKMMKFWDLNNYKAKKIKKITRANVDNAQNKRWLECLMIMFR